MNTKELILAQEFLKCYVLDKMSETMTDGQLKHIIAGYGGYNGPWWKLQCVDGMKFCLSTALVADCQKAIDMA